MLTQPDEIAAVIKRCVAGDDEARAVFMLEFGGVVRRAIVRKMATVTGEPALRQEADDLCNDVMARLLADDCRLLGTVREPGRIHAWLVTVAQRCCLDALRRRSSRARAEEVLRHEEARAEPERSAAEILAKEEAAQRARELLTALSDQDRLVLELYFFHECKYIEIAEIMGLNINTVAARLRRAKAKLKDVMERDDVVSR
ncbi:MAG: RNA polymerase sigma factor [Candidatus Hydrogenedentota bacterium]